MPATSSRAEPSAVAEPFSDSAINTTRMSDREAKRLFRLRVWVWGKQFAARLKANAQWTRLFLHGGK